MTKFYIGDRVRILDTAFGDSSEPKDIASRGLEGNILYDLEVEHGASWADCWVVTLDSSLAILGDARAYVTGDEIELVAKQ